MEKLRADPAPRGRRIRLVGRFLRASPLNLVGGTIVAVVLLVSVVGLTADLLGVRFTPYDPLAPNLADRLEPPSPSHLMGTDHLGRDLFSRVLAGTHIAVEVALIVLVIALAIGIVVGLTAGLAGGLVDEVLMRLTDLFLAFPALILAAAITFTLGASLQTTMVALAAVYWPWYARIARGQVLSLREQEFVLAARTMGAGRVRLMFGTLLPSVTPILLVQATLDVGYVMLSTAGLSFLGLGAQPPTPEWGSTILAALPYQPGAWWYAAFPGLALAVTALGFNLLGDGLRDWLDPVLRSSRLDEADVVP
jgi:peptide/nickel transport system permease protein